MLAIYLASLIAGGGLLLWSMAGGGDAEDADTGEAHGGDGWLSALPFSSLTFWTFFLAFFGLTGSTLTLFGLAGSAAITATLAAALGLGAGFTIALVMKRLRREVVDSSIRALDFVGEVGRALLPVAVDQPGKVRLQLRGRAVDLIAHTEEPTPIPANAEVVVHEVTDDGAVKVVPLIDDRRLARR